MNVRTSVAALGLLASACYAPGPGAFYAEGYWWEPDPSRPACPGGAIWDKQSPAVVREVCGKDMEGCSPYPCSVVSLYGEEEAKRTFFCGESLSHWTHEAVWHVAKQLRHPRGSPRGC